MGFLSKLVKVLSIPLIIVSTCYIGLLFIEKYEERQEEQRVKKVIADASRKLGEAASDISKQVSDGVANFIKWAEGNNKNKEDRKQELVREKEKAKQMVLNAVRAGTITDKQATEKLTEIDRKFEEAYKEYCR